MRRLEQVIQGRKITTTAFPSPAALAILYQFSFQVKDHACGIITLTQQKNLNPSININTDLRPFWWTKLPNTPTYKHLHAYFISPGSRVALGMAVSAGWLIHSATLFQTQQLLNRLPLKVCPDVDVPQRMNPNDFGVPLPFLDWLKERRQATLGIWNKNGLWHQTWRQAVVRHISHHVIVLASSSWAC